jgi:aspartate-semialdehyde dehydrogenase
VSHVPSSKLYNVAVVGATGLVGQQFLRILAKRHFPLRNLRLFASRRSAGKRLTFGEREIEVQETTPKALAGSDLVFISATDEVSRQLPPALAKNGAVVIDDSGVWRMEPNVPLVVPEVNPDDLAQHDGILSIPNCSTTPIVMCLWPLHRVNPVKRVIAATYQSVSGTGQAAVQELTEQTHRVLENQPAMPHVMETRNLFVSESPSASRPPKADAYRPADSPAPTWISPIPLMVCRYSLERGTPSMPIPLRLGRFRPRAPDPIDLSIRGP